MLTTNKAGDAMNANKYFTNLRTVRDILRGRRISA